MKFTISWLKEFLETEASSITIIEKLSLIGLEVEDYTDFAKVLADFTVAEITEAKAHPDADKLKLCKVRFQDSGDETADYLQIVCGAANARAGIKVALAKVGVEIPANGMKIKKSKIRGVESCGMLCSEEELGLAEKSEGIIELPMHAKVGDNVAQYIGKDDCLVEIAITPNRGDALGVYGIARDLAAAGLGQMKFSYESCLQEAQEYFASNKGDYESPVSISLQQGQQSAKDLGVNWFVAVHVNDLANKPSPEWLKNRLEAIGKKSISALVDITNYLVFTYGRPAHVYDADKISGDLVIRHAREGELFSALDNNDYTLASDMLVVADSNCVQSLAGVIGGANSACQIDTKNIILEIAHFVPDVVSVSGRKLHIDTDSRYRFEREVDYNSWLFTLHALRMIKEICGNDVTAISKPRVLGDIKFKAKYIEYPYALSHDLASISISKEDTNKILSQLGFKQKDGSALSLQNVLSDTVELQVPSFRPDISIKQDIAEEVARIAGYDKITKGSFLRKISSSNYGLNISRKAYNFKSAKIPAIKRVLCSFGYDELVTFSFLSKLDADKFACDSSQISVANPISEELSVMRPSILPNLLAAIDKNYVRNRVSYKFFEYGKIFYKDKEAESSKDTVNYDREGCFIQPNVFTGVAFEPSKKPKSLLPAVVNDFFTIKSEVDSILANFINISTITPQVNDSYKYYHPSKSCVYKLGRNVIAVIGQLHPRATRDYEFDGEVYAFEIFFDNIPMKEVKTYTRSAPVDSIYQAVERDFAFVVDSDLAVIELVNIARKASPLITKVDIFDIYQGQNIADGKKSVAFNIRITPKDETLSDKDIEVISDKVILSISEKLNGELRSVA